LSYGFYTKIVTDYPLMCVAVVALSLDILLLCFITFIAWHHQLRLSTTPYDDVDDDVVFNKNAC